MDGVHPFGQQRNTTLAVIDVFVLGGLAAWLPVWPRHPRGLLIWGAVGQPVLLWGEGAPTCSDTEIIERMRPNSRSDLRDCIEVARSWNSMPRTGDNFYLVKDPYPCS